MICTLRERFLARRGLEFEHIRDYPLEKLNAPKDDVKQQIRIDGTDPRHVEYFAEIARRGAARELPPIIVFRRQGGDEIGDGMHRVPGLLSAGVLVHSAYVVRTDDEAVIQMIRRVANIELNGKGISEDDRLRHAMAFKRAFPEQSVESVAGNFGVTPSSLGKGLRRDEVTYSLQEQGFSKDSLRKLRATHLDALYQHSPIIREHAARAITQTGMGPDDATAMLAQAKKKRSEAAQLAYIEEASSQYQTRARSGLKHVSPMRRWRAAIGAIRSICTNGAASELTKIQRDELRDELTATYVTISEFVEKL